MRNFYTYAATAPDRVAVVHPDGQAVTYAELLADANRISNFLLAHGAEREDAVATLLPNGYPVLAAVRGTMQLPLFFTPINWHLTATEISHILADSKALVLFTAEPFLELARAAASLAGLPPDRVVPLGVVDSGSGSRLSGPVGAASPERPPVSGAGQRMLYTSGTTGPPKAVRRPLRDQSPEQAASSALARAKRYNADHEDGVFLGMAPMYHASPLAYADQSLDVGHTIVLLERWNRERVLAVIEQRRVTWTYLVPLMMQELLALSAAERAEVDLSSLRSIVHTAAPCPPHVKSAMIEWLGPILTEIYGGTEGGATVISSAEWLTHVGSVGRPLGGVSLRILDEHHAEVPTGEVGTVYFKNEDMSFVYLGDPEKTAAARFDGHITLGDLGRTDAEGYLYLSDRAADLIISGGVNIYPAEIEHALLRLPGVEDVCVVGRPDEHWGECVHAVVVTSRPGAHGEAGELRSLGELGDAGDLIAALDAELRVELAGDKVPRSWAFVDALPRSATGKLLRREVRERASESRA